LVQWTEEPYPCILRKEDNNEETNMSSKERLEHTLRRIGKKDRKEFEAVSPGDSLADYIKLLYEMDQEAKHAAKMRNEGDAT
jgi:hypothetical protein